MAMPLFDLHLKSEVREVGMLKDKGILQWLGDISYDEKQSCLAKGRRDCARAHGKFAIGSVKLRDVRLGALCEPRASRGG